MEKVTDKEMAELYFNLYTGCIKYKKQKENKKVIDCSKYFKSFVEHSDKCLENKNIFNKF
jgi:hypothetical protein